MPADRQSMRHLRRSSSGSIVSAWTSSIAAFFEDPIDDFSFQDLGHERVGPSFLFESSAHPANALVGSRGDRFDLEGCVLFTDFDLLGIGDSREQQKLLERAHRRLMGIGPDLGFAGPDLVVGHAPRFNCATSRWIGRFLLAAHQVGRKLERRRGSNWSTICRCTPGVART